MRVRVDTHVRMWWDAGRRLSKETVVAIPDIAASESGFRELPIEVRHAERVREPRAHHRDPFDRIMIA